MGRYDNNLKCAELRKLVGDRKYKQAFQVLQEIDVDKVRLVTDLNAFAEVYRKAGKYEKAREMLIRVYEKSPSKRVVYKLACIAILEKNFEVAEGYYQDYMQENPESEERYVLRYRIDKAKQMGYDVRIKDLEALKEYEYIEEWGYELAKLYHKAGMADKCVEECNDIILWFGEGVIVEKARMLRSYYLEGNRVLGSYGGNLERARERARRQEERAKSMKMDTSELSEQIQEYAAEDHYEELKKELENELKDTSDLQASMKTELGLSDTSDIREEISRIIKEQEEEEALLEEQEENNGWLFNFGKKNKKAAKAEDTIKNEKKNTRDEEAGEDWEPDQHERGRILSVQQSLEDSLGESVAKIFEEDPPMEKPEEENDAGQHTVRIDDIERERLNLLRKADKAGNNRNKRKFNNIRSDEAGENYINEEKANSIKYDEAEEKDRNKGNDDNIRYDEAEEKDINKGKANNVKYDEAGENDTAKENDPDKTEADKPGEGGMENKKPHKSGKSDEDGKEDLEKMIVKRNRQEDSSVIPIDEIKAALSGVRKKTKSPGFETIDLDDDDVIYKGGKNTQEEYDEPVKPVEIQIHFGERYQDFVGEEEYKRTMEEQNSRNSGQSGEDPEDDLPSMADVEKCRREMAKEEGYKIAGIDLQEIFQSFMEYDNIKNQLINIFREIEEKDIKTCNFVIAGDAKSGKTTLGRRLAKAMMERKVIPTKPIAKIRAEKFNMMNFEKHKVSLKDSCLIVERAGGMTVPAINNLKSAMDDYSGHIVVIMEDSQTNMERLFLENYQLNTYFSFTIKL